MLYFLKQTFNKHQSFSESIFFYLLKHCQLLTSNDFPCGPYITLPHLTMTSFKARDVTFKYAELLKIGMLALCQERTMFIVLKFENTMCIGSRTVKLKPIPGGISSEWYAIFVS